MKQGKEVQIRLARRVMNSPYFIFEPVSQQFMYAYINPTDHGNQPTL